MNQPAEQKQPRYVTCCCQHCDGNIEFDANELVEENSIVPCPHCGLETKLFIPTGQTEKAPTELPSSIASPNAVRREGFFCGGGEPIIAQVAAEQPATEVWREWQFKIVTLEQGTDAWREWRHNGIGASDASTIMGENRFKSAAQLLQEKRGPALDYGQNAAMARGTELEPEARRLYVAKTGREVRPACLQSTRYEWLRASLDGLAVNDDAAVEIKCGQSAYRTASQSRSVPDYYYGQLQHILAVTGFDSLDFWCYWPGYPAILIPVPRNVVYIERLLNKEQEFWNLVQRNPSSYPVASTPELTEDQIKSVGERQNDDMALKLNEEGEQNMMTSFDDARRYIADPRFKLIDPETGIRFTPATLEAFIKAKRLQNKISPALPNEPKTQKPIPDAEQNPIPISVIEIPAPHKHKRVRFTKGTRIALSPAQCASPTGEELINLLGEIVHDGLDTDGLVTEDGVQRLNAWLDKKADSDIPAIKFLLQISDRILRTGKVTTAKAFEMHFAIERVLPISIRDGFKKTRQEAWLHSPLKPKATEAQLEYIRDLGGTPSPGLNISEASLLIEKLLENSTPPSELPATEKQLHFIRELGGNPPMGISRDNASALIEQLQAKRHESFAREEPPSPRQIMVLRFWNRMDLAQSSKWEVEQWQNQFYAENPRRKAAWETFKLENGDDGSQHDPSCVPIGAGESYLDR